jgi:Spy/CpxP family protein refolding chaperone
MKRILSPMSLAAVGVVLAAQVFAQAGGDQRQERRRDSEFGGGRKDWRTGEERKMGPDADGPSAMNPIMRMLGNPKIVKELGLSEAQVKTLRDAEFETQKRFADLRAELEKAGLDQAKLMTETSVDEKALMATVEKTGALRTEMAKLHVRQLLLLRNTLTPEQRDKAQAMMRRAMEQRRSHAEGRQGAQGAGPMGPGPDGQRAQGQPRPQGTPPPPPQDQEPMPPPPAE